MQPVTVAVPTPVARYVNVGTTGVGLTEGVAVSLGDALSLGDADSDGDALALAEAEALTPGVAPFSSTTGTSEKVAPQPEVADETKTDTKPLFCSKTAFPAVGALPKKVTAVRLLYPKAMKSMLFTDFGITSEVRTLKRKAPGPMLETELGIDKADKLLTWKELFPIVSRVQGRSNEVRPFP